jgi:uncharacterized membrane-anchored protein
MKRWVAVAVAVAQIGVLGFMAGQREWVMHTGRTLYLRTAPIDPDDPMRGAYVRLNYEIADVPRALCRDGLASWFEDNTVFSRERRDQVVYAALRLNDEGVAELMSLSDQRPAEMPFVRGRVDHVTPSGIRVRYGVEALFMMKQAAREFDELAFNTRAGVPVNAEIAVSDAGLAVLKGYRWEPLGITIQTIRAETAGTAQAGPGQRPELAGLTVELKNHSDAPIAIVDGGRGGCLRLVADPRRGMSQYEWVGRAAGAPAPAASDVVVLTPGAMHEIHIDFADPRWFVIARQAADPKPVSLSDIPNAWGAWLRIEYHPPTREEVAGWSDAELIRHATLRSRAFSPAGGFD